LTRSLIVANWKMHKTIGESVAFAESLKTLHTDLRECDIVIAPPFTSLRSVADAVAGSSIGIAAQNLHHHADGAYTGEVSARMLIDAGCQYVIIGHSERRIYFGENDQLINQKIKMALQSGLVPIFCIGETLPEREQEKTYEVVEKQLKEGLNNFGADDIGRLVIAYEPVWAIGTGRTATPEQAEDVHIHIRRVMFSKYGDLAASQIRIIYGGSVNAENIAKLKEKKAINGVLVGGASLKVESFSKIVGH
jgi:triosephosphate isomerase (TIM)